MARARRRYGNRKRKRTYKRRFKRRVKRRRARNVSILSPSRGVGLAKRAVVKLRYTTSISLFDAIVSHKKHDFRANSIYDIDLTGTGKQPPFLDDLRNLYVRYRVNAIKAKVRFYNATEGPVNCWVALMTDPNALLDTTYAITPMRSGPLSAAREISALSAGARNATTISRYWKFRKCFAHTDWDNDQTASVINTNPALALTMSIGAQDVAGTHNIDVIATVEIIQYVELFRMLTSTQMTLDNTT